jgi:hypothetical protein
MRVQRLPWVTIAIIALNLAVFLVTWPQARADYQRMEEGDGDGQLRLRAPRLKIPFLSGQTEGRMLHWKAVTEVFDE